MKLDAILRITELSTNKVVFNRKFTARPTFDGLALAESILGVSAKYYKIEYFTYYRG